MGMEEILFVRAVLPYIPLSQVYRDVQEYHGVGLTRDEEGAVRALYGLSFMGKG